MRRPRALIMCVLLAGATDTQAAPVIWIGPNPDNAIQLARPWPAETGKEIGGIKLYIDWLRRGTDGDLQRMATRVRERNLRVAVEVGGLLNHDWGNQIAEKSLETELPPLRRWRHAGGRLDVLELDGSIRRAMGFDGWGKSPTRTFTDYSAIARELEEYLTGMAKEFPDVRFHHLVNFPNWGWRGEPSYHGGGANQQDYGDYFDALSALLRLTQPAPPRFRGLTIDNPYDYTTGQQRSGSLQEPARVDWLGRIADVCKVARTNGLECGLIVNTEGGGKKSDEAFAEGTLAFARLVQQRGLRFDHLIVQSWYPFPTSVVGDTLPAHMAVAAEVAWLFARPVVGAHR